ncbi:type II secretion system F family protein [Vannielia litorea]|uniref:type II secretion system F family protein n=1 Tax=Vannielia litorea TaxID=1217970 RepID=UPI001BCF62DC|nr:type II secretion system F family protein [Vannielia litorea]MBS8225604.1 type II secretion system F family protein [Vannielia litorea]
MSAYFTDLLTRFGLSLDMVLLVAFGLGAGLLFVSLVVLLGQKNAAAVRIAQTRTAKADARFERGLLRDTVRTPKGILRIALPTNEDERRKMELKFRQAGYVTPTAMRVYTSVRMLLGFGLPAAFILALVAAKLPGLPVPEALASRLNGLGRLGIMQIIAVMVAVGYYLPALWLNSRVTERRLRITESFPNALDLMQVATEAGLGFDAAMTRVGNELAGVSPEIAFEFLSAQHQISAGRSRDAALMTMAENTGVDMVRSFATVVSQSIQFGTPMAEALTTYAAEMRLERELKAQEMANKLPVKMSGVLASLMLPAVVLVTIGPVVIRYIRVFGD